MVKRVLGMGLVLCLCVLAPAPAQAHVKRYPTDFNALADASSDSFQVSLDVNQLDCLEERTVNIYDTQGKLLASGSPSAGAYSTSFPIDTGDVFNVKVTRLVFKRNARHTHLCKGHREEVTAVP